MPPHVLATVKLSDHYRMAFFSPLVYHWYVTLLSNTFVFLFVMEEIQPNDIKMKIKQKTNLASKTQ